MIALSLHRMSLPLRWCVVSAAVAGVVGAVIGGILGLRAHPPTAWFAIIEVGLPSGLVGATTGLVAGAVVSAARRGR